MTEIPNRRADRIDGRAFTLAILLLAMAPLLWPWTPPLNDMPGHIGRYHLHLVLGDGGPLDAFFAMRWAVIGNLGVDLIVALIAPVIGVELAAKLVVTAIPALTCGGIIALSRVVHGRLTAPAILAFPLAYSFPLQMGFVNFALSAALALWVLAAWIRWAGRPGLRIALALPAAGAIWLSHSFGWAMLGLACGGAEIALRRARGDGWPAACLRAGLACAPLAWPILLMMTAPVALHGVTGDWFNMWGKAQWIVSLLRERWKWWDVAGAVVIVCATWGLWRSRTVRIAPVLGVPACLFLVAFLLVPRLFQGGSYVDMRILPYAFILALVACAPRDRASERRLLVAAIAFFVVRTGGTMLAFGLFAQEQERALRAVDAIPRGAAVLVLVDEPCSSEWTNGRMGHIAGLAIARKEAFVNEQWALPGQQLVTPTLRGAAPFDRDPSHLVYPVECGFRTVDYDDVLRRFDRRAFDHVWTIGFAPARAAGHRGLTPIWSDGRSALFRVSGAS